MENNYSNIFFLGIGGIGMSALAQYFHSSGYKVAGYDRVQSEICVRLENQGIAIHYEDDIKNIPADFLNTAKTLVILTPAIPSEHSELNYFINNGFQITKRSEILGMISNPKKGLAIAGTHGKTSVSGICANIMSQTKNSCSAFLGGIAKNFNSNLVLNTESEYVVVEADEFDRSFHRLTPSTALITCIEADHLDIYKDFESLKEAFVIFGNKVKNDGNLILNKSIGQEIKKSFKKELNIFTYGLNDSSCDFYIGNVSYENESCVFDINYPGGKIESIKYRLGGNHNLENALAGASVSLLNGAGSEDVRKGLESFRGIVRRFDYRVKNSDHTYIDDYAHHPGEITAFLSAVRLLYPDRKITGVFQPHLFSRTADFYQGFAESLSLCDELILLPVYPAREKPVPGVSSKMIFDLVSSPEKHLCDKDELLNMIEKLNPGLLVTMGAGDIDLFINPIEKLLNK